MGGQTRKISKAPARGAGNKIVDLRQHASPDVEAIARENQKVTAEKKFLEKLLQIEAGIRSRKSLQELKYYVANELKTVLPCQQVLILKVAKGSRKLVVDTVSNLAMPDQHSPVLQWLTAELNREWKVWRETPIAPKDVGSETVSHIFRLNTNSAPHGEFSAPNGLMAFLENPRQQTIGAIVCLSDEPFPPANKNLTDRIAQTVAHAWNAFDRGRLIGRLSIPRPLKFLLAAALLLVCFIPVPLTVLAPVEIVPDHPLAVTAPLNGVIEKVLVEPNAMIKAGTPLFSYEKSDAMNLLEQANRQLAVATAKFQRANQDAFGSRNGRRDLAVAKAELQLAKGERDAAERKMQLTEVKAGSSGLALFESKEKWLGRPVSVGERVMRLADPNRFRFKLDLPVQEAIILSQMHTARVFLDADPLYPFKIEIQESSYKARLSDSNVLVFPLLAKLADTRRHIPLRIGLRGTAQLSGNDVPLWFFLFRKPLSFLRQTLGF